MSIQLRRSWLAAASIVVFFGGGVVVGLRRVEDTSWAVLSSFAYQWTAARGAYEHATPGTIALLERYAERAANPPHVVASFVVPSRVLALAMSADLRDRNGDANAANSAWQEAEQACVAATWKDCTKEHLVAAISKKQSAR
jgi:hypothetical protein